MDNRSLLNRIRQDKNAMSNKTIQSVFSCLDSGDHAQLIELYRNTCSTMGVKPNEQYLK